MGHPELAACALAVAFFATTHASAGPRPKITGVCTGCLVSVPAKSDAASAPSPLLVTLHGDWGAMAPELHAAWERFAATRDVALLSLTCPVELGCKRSWWEWNGNPSWITDQIARLTARHAIDQERMWLAGWSGGAAYMGMHTQELEKTFAALVMHGGGTWPSRGGCATEKSAVVFLAGDQNPLHPRVLKLREHYDACGNDVTFTLLRGAEHDGEWRALDKHGGAILDLLATKRRVAVAAATPPTPPIDAPAATSATAPATASPLPSSAPHPPEPVPPRTGCGCTLAQEAANMPWLFAACLLAFAAGRKYARKDRQDAE